MLLGTPYDVYIVHKPAYCVGADSQCSKCKTCLLMIHTNQLIDSFTHVLNYGLIASLRVAAYE